jgi:hypothetical protein
MCFLVGHGVDLCYNVVLSSTRFKAPEGQMFLSRVGVSEVLLRDVSPDSRNRTFDSRNEAVGKNRLFP